MALARFFGWMICVLALACALPADLKGANTLHVPAEYSSIQAAIDAAEPGDTVLVSTGLYVERIKLKPNVILRSEGDDRQGRLGLARAESTIIDGRDDDTMQPGVVMAEASTIDGFTLTGVGNYIDEVWQRHFDSHGEELGDDEGSVQAEGTMPAISIDGVNCTVINNIVHHNGDVGIAIVGNDSVQVSPRISNNFAYRNLGGGIGIAEKAQPIVQHNQCFENLRTGIGCRDSNPIIIENHCFQNIRAGIGCREGARPLIRGNICYQNRRAGIGVRMEGTAPVVEDNLCYENAMVGIGCRDGAAPVIRNNKCLHNSMAGIGSDGGQPLIVGNECRENLMAGIGLRGASTAIVKGNLCSENKLVAIGVTQDSIATIQGNRLVRSSGQPPIIAVKDGSTATILENDIEGGGVAAVLVQGTATINGNRFVGIDDSQGTAIWIWDGSTSIVSDNRFDDYSAAVSAKGSAVVVTGNSIRGFQRVAIKIEESSQPAYVLGNTAFSSDAQAKVVDIQGETGVARGNTVQQKSK